MSGFNLSRFANPARTARLNLGACQCPETPHAEGDWVDHRLEFGSGELERIGAYGMARGEGGFDFGAATDKLIEVGVVRWNLLGPDGEEVPVSVASISLLDAATRSTISEAIDKAIPDKARATPLPNASGARSRGSTRASASRSRTTPRKR